MPLTLSWNGLQQSLKCMIQILQKSNNALSPFCLPLMFFMPFGENKVVYSGITLLALHRKNANSIGTLLLMNGPVNIPLCSPLSAFSICSRPFPYAMKTPNYYSHCVANPLSCLCRQNLQDSTFPVPRRDEPNDFISVDPYLGETLS